MTRGARIARDLAIGTVLGVLLLSFVTLRGNRVFDSEPHSVNTGAEIADYSDPIYDSQDAISRTLAILSPQYQIIDQIARLIDYDTATSWSNTSVALSEPHAPVWLVSTLATNMIASDIVDETIQQFQPDQDHWNTPVDGLFVIWDANSGLIVQRGEVHVEQHALLAGIPDMALSISAATELPPFPTMGPEEYP